MKLNLKASKPAVLAAPVKSTAESMLELRRSVATCLLWEDTFYEDGEGLAQRLARLVPLCPFDFVAAVAVEARTKHMLRHVPLLLLRELLRHPQRVPAQVRELFPAIITRADQLAEFVKVYWATNGGKKTLPAQAKKGLALAFEQFNAYALAKNDHQSAEVRLRDVAFLAHPQSAKDERGVLFTPAPKERIYKDRLGKVLGIGKVVRYDKTTLAQLCEGRLPTPDTWEVALSAAKSPSDKAEVWLRLLAEGQLGGLAWLRNLRNMAEVGVLHETITDYGAGLAERGKLKGILPFQFLTAARINPWAESTLGALMLLAVKDLTLALAGQTLVLVDVSGSMDSKLSSKGDVTRLDAACGLAILAREVCQNVQVWTFSNRLVRVGAGEDTPSGFALRNVILKSQPHSGTALRGAVLELHAHGMNYDRILVITDEQSTDGALPPARSGAKGYIMNVAGYEKGVATGAWTTVSGWSPAVLNYIVEHEAL